MPARLFDSNSMEYNSIAVNVAEHVTIAELKERILEKFEDQGMENSIAVADSENLAVGCGRFQPGAESHEEIPVSYEEVLVVLEGDVTLTVDGEPRKGTAGQFFYIEAGTKVRFASESGCRLLFVTSPPVWKSFEAAYKAGKLK